MLANTVSHLQRYRMELDDPFHVTCCACCLWLSEYWVTDTYIKCIFFPLPWRLSQIVCWKRHPYRVHGCSADGTIIFQVAWHEIVMPNNHQDFNLFTLAVQLTIFWFCFHVEWRINTNQALGGMCRAWTCSLKGSDCWAELVELLLANCSAT